MNEKRLIDANILKRHYSWWGDNEYRKIFDGIIDDQPTADVAPIAHGEWLTSESMLFYGQIYCSVCGVEAPSKIGRYTYLHSNFCPNCGAKMDGKELK